VQRSLHRARGFGLLWQAYPAAAMVRVYYLRSGLHLYRVRLVETGFKPAPARDIRGISHWLVSGQS
jgi:hypothetical protein